MTFFKAVTSVEVNGREVLFTKEKIDFPPQKTNESALKKIPKTLEIEEREEINPEVDRIFLGSIDFTMSVLDREIRSPIPVPAGSKDNTTWSVVLMLLSCENK